MSINHVDSSLYVSGPEDRHDIPEESMGKYYLNILKSRNPEEIVNIDAITGEILTCRQLLDKSVKLAKIFQNFSLTKGDVIALIVPNNIYYNVPVLAGLYTGVIVALLNSEYSLREFRHAFETVRPKLVVGTEEVIDLVKNLQEELEFIQKMVLFDELLQTDVVLETDNFETTQVDFKNQGAFVFMSSGTTGLPKGVLVTHQNFRMTISYFKDPNNGKMESTDFIPLPVPYYHIYGFGILMTAVTSKCHIIVMKKFKPDVYLNSIQKYKVKKLFIVPPLLLFLVKHPLVNNYDLSSLEDVIVAAAPVGPELHSEATLKYPNIIIRQIYGITETAGASISQSVTVRKPGSVGLVVPGVLVKIEDPETRKTLGPYDKGELCVRGPVVMKEYVRNEEATRESIDEDGFYHTGDICYYDRDKHFYVVDRIKELIKYKGFQVAPAEVESLLLSHEEIDDAALLGIPDEKVGQLPMALVVKKKGSVVTEQEIVQFVAERISVIKHLHGGVKFVDQIPKSAAGKILRRDLHKLLDDE